MSYSIDKIIALSKQRGFIFQGSEIYGGLANTYDFGPLGVLMKNNIKSAWWNKFVVQNPLNYGVDCAILMNPLVWEASGHIGGFSDPLMDCLTCKTRHRADHIIEAFNAKKDISLNISSLNDKQLEEYIKENKIACPSCGSQTWTPIRKFNLMFKTFQGVTEDSANTVYLRPETAQGIFVNFKNIQRSTRARIPFGVGQIGKSFRNEITPGNFIFRVREFEQMELEFFCKGGTDLEWFNYWLNFSEQWLYSLGIKKELLKIRAHEKEELSHYSVATSDFEFKFPFGWSELWGIADRTDYDLKCHSAKSGENLEYIDPITNERYIPYCIEPSLGVERLFLALLCNGYDEELVEGEGGKSENRVVLRLHPYIAPYKAAVLPLIKKLTPEAEVVFKTLSKKFSCTFDEAGTIGKRYRRQDEIGTPFCITFDFDSLNDNAVTIRDRDTMKQERVPIADLVAFLDKATEL